MKGQMRSPSEAAGLEFSPAKIRKARGAAKAMSWWWLSGNFKSRMAGPKYHGASQSVERKPVPPSLATPAQYSLNGVCD